jgi:hypothetical protein
MEETMESFSSFLLGFVVCCPLLNHSINQSNMHLICLVLILDSDDGYRGLQWQQCVGVGVGQSKKVHGPRPMSP